MCKLAVASVKDQTSFKMELLHRKKKKKCFETEQILEFSYAEL